VFDDARRVRRDGLEVAGELVLLAIGNAEVSVPCEELFEVAVDPDIASVGCVVENETGKTSSNRPFDVVTEIVGLAQERRVRPRRLRPVRRAVWGRGSSSTARSTAPITSGTSYHSSSRIGSTRSRSAPSGSARKAAALAGWSRRTTVAAFGPTCGVVLDQQEMSFWTKPRGRERSEVHTRTWAITVGPVCVDMVTVPSVLTPTISERPAI